MRKSAFPVLLLFFLFSVGVVIVSQKQQELRTRASANTTLVLLPSTSIMAPITRRVGDTVAFDVILNPGSNQVSTVKVHIGFDSSVFEASEKNGFVINKKAFPFAVEGPLINNDYGSVIATFFVGADPNQTIKVPTKIGTLNLTAVRETYNLSSSKILFEETSQAYSVSSQDYAYENVIATTLPAYVVVVPRDTAAVPTKSDVMVTLTPAVATPSATTVPSQTTPTVPLLPTAPSKELTLSLKVFFSGIGKNPLENNSPKRIVRYVKIFLVNSKNFVATVHNVELRYDEADGSFGGTLIVPDFEAGNYTVQIKADGYPQAEISKSRFLSVGSEYTMPPASLVAGDINNDGKVNIVDYNLLFACSAAVIDPAKCSKQARILADLDDNGRVDENDQFIFIKQNE